MTAAFVFLYTLFVVYLIPFIFAMGLIYLFYGGINYYIIGANGDEGRREEGRQELFWVFLLFLLGLVLYGVVMVAVQLGNSVAQVDIDTSGVAEPRQTQDVLPVPNVPLNNN